MTHDKSAESDTTENGQKGRRQYVAPTVSDFFQPVVALGTIVTDFCAASKPPKH